MNYYGTIRDAETEIGIPGATVLVRSANGETLGSDVAGSDGTFFINTIMPGATIVASSVGYNTWVWPATTYQQTFDLERNTVPLPPVILPPGVTTAKKTPYLIYALMGLALLIATKKRK